MSLSSLQLDAFAEVARTRKFAKAAKNLSITQSALSQRVLNLEQELGTTLFIRDAAGARLTAAGNRLLAYCRMREGMESELVRELVGDQAPESVGGIVRVGAFSSVLRSVVFASLEPLLKKCPGVTLELGARELRDLPQLLRNGEIDYAVIEQPLEAAGYLCQLLGHEENVLVESARAGARKDTYLDHDADDQTTESYLRQHGEKPGMLKRFFLDDVYGILDGAEAGWGRAVVPRHLAESRKGLRLVRGYRAVRSPVHLAFREQPFYPRLHARVVEALTEGAARLL